MALYKCHLVTSLTQSIVHIHETRDPAVNLDLKGRWHNQQYAPIKISLQIFQASAVGNSTLGLNFLPSLRGEFLQSRPDPFQLSFGFGERSVGRGVISVTFHDGLCASESEASNTCRVHDISKGLPTLARHLGKY